MVEYIKSDEFIRIATESSNFNELYETILKIHPRADKRQVRRRLSNYRRKGLLPLDSGNSVSTGEVLRGTSTLFDENGDIVLQWVKSDVDKSEQLTSINEAIKSLAAELPSLPLVSAPTPESRLEDTATLYITNDVHFGALMWAPESGENWDTTIADQTLRAAYDHLFSVSPSSPVGIVVDLGDLMEIDSFKNLTPQSGNPLAVDGRFPKIMRTAYSALIYAINLALTKHEVVHFINIAGNHDMTVGHAIREVIRAAFAANPRVIIDESPSAIKYFGFGEVLLQFAHGDGLKMKDAGEVMAHDCQSIFSDTKYRYAHFGHNHKDSVYDGRLCRCESHRNLAPLNDWAAHKGFRRQPGTMKSITYHAHRGEISRSLFTLT